MTARLKAELRLIAELRSAFRLHRSYTTPWDTTILRDGFGERPAFQVLIAELDGSAIGYALFTDGYNTDIPARAVWLDDIFVEKQARGQGIGRRLLASVARIAAVRGARSVWWGVRSANHRARAFYAGLGAKDDDARILELNDEALLALAAEATPSPKA